jgi:Sec-independent protein secretion pathway component TatC
MPPSDKKIIDPAAEIDKVRMSFGDHIEELRRRVIWSLLGLLIATILCFHFGDLIIGILTAPYIAAMENLGFDPRMVQLDPTEAFMEYFKISLKFGVVLATPWVLYQMWKFIAAGLYPAEKKLVRLFAPTSIVLFVIGASFMVVVVLSGLITFLINMSTWFPFPDDNNALYNFLSKNNHQQVATTQPSAPPVLVPILEPDPQQPADGQVWFNPNRQTINVQLGNETYAARLEKLSAKQLVQPLMSIAQYLGFVVNLGLAFGLGFQIPIVVVFLIALRIISAKQMSAARKYVILGIAILAAVLTPSPDAGTMMMLAVPMQVLFEIGLFIGWRIERRQAPT